MDVVLQELKSEDEKALRARVQKAASASTRCRPSLPSTAPSQLQSSGHSLSPAGDDAAFRQQDDQLVDQPQQGRVKKVPVMLPPPVLGPRIDRDLLRIDSEVLSVRKAALSSLHELLVPSVTEPLQV